jgi:hypothetical protein
LIEIADCGRRRVVSAGGCQPRGQIHSAA